MKTRGGYTPRIAGRPLNTVEEVPLAPQLRVSLERHGAAYAPSVKEGDPVRLGTALAEGSLPSGSVYLPSPAAGRIVAVQTGESDRPATIALETGGDAVDDFFHPCEPDRITADTTRDVLARGGIWPFFWSSASGGIPPLDGTEQPRAIIVNCLSAEPFLARGNVILGRSWDRVVAGLRFLPRLLADYGTIELVLTHQRHPLAQRIYRELAGQAWLRFHPVPLRYPVEDPRVLRSALLRTDRAISRGDVVWVIDVQGVEALGACLGEGIPLHRRLVAVGGPAQPDPRHLDMPIGTPLESLPGADRDGVRVLRGGLFKGRPVEPGSASLDADDAGFFFLPDPSHREFLSFVNPGFDRVSILPCFATSLTRAADRHVSTYLRGESRPCIACGLCEKVCPAGLLPQVLHRYLYAGQIDEAETAGLELCIDCAVCTYVCPSKIELLDQFTEARAQIRREKEEAAQSAEATASADDGEREDPPA